jgi:hypothetical protein
MGVQAGRCAEGQARLPAAARCAAAQVPAAPTELALCDGLCVRVAQLDQGGRGGWPALRPLLRPLPPPLPLRQLLPTPDAVLVLDASHQPVACAARRGLGGLGAAAGRLALLPLPGGGGHPGAGHGHSGGRSRSHAHLHAAARKAQPVRAGCAAARAAGAAAAAVHGALLREGPARQARRRALARGVCVGGLPGRRPRPLQRQRQRQRIAAAAQAPPTPAAPHPALRRRRGPG